MSTLEQVKRWLRSGNRIQSFARVLRKPMTPSEICKTLQASGIKVDLRDVSSMMKRFQQRKVASCLNSRRVTGKLYTLTELGRAAVFESFGIQVEAPPSNINWNKYSKVVSASIRKAVLEEVGRKHFGMHCDKPASEIRRFLLERYPMSLNHVRNALQELEVMGLVFVADYTKKRRLKLYRLTREGERVLYQIEK